MAPIVTQASAWTATSSPGAACSHRRTSTASPLRRSLPTRQQSRRQQQSRPAAGSSSEEQQPQEQLVDAGVGAAGGEQYVQLGPRDDDILPDSLTDALVESSKATVEAVERGVDRCIVEILLPELWDPLSGPVYAEEGDQQRFWKLTRRFLDNLALLMPGKCIKAVYPDVGVSAMLKNQWTDATFGFASLDDRRPVAADDDVIVLAAPDPQGADDAIRITQSLTEGQCIVMFNPRLASGDVGVGLSIRRMRDNFLSAFTTTYSLRPIADVGSVFRRYPGMWMVFVQDGEVQGRYKLIAERLSRPGGEDLDYILAEEYGSPASGEGGEQGSGPGFVDRVGLTISGLQRFMRSLSQ